MLRYLEKTMLCLTEIITDEKNGTKNNKVNENCFLGLNCLSGVSCFGFSILNRT